MQMLTALSMNMPLLASTGSGISTPPVILRLVPPLPSDVDVFIPANDVPGSALTDAVYDQGSVIVNAIGQLLSQELKRESGNAQALAVMAERLTGTIRSHLPALSAALSPSQRETIRQIAGDSSIGEQSAMIEYLSNASLFRALRDYHELPARDVFSKDDRVAGFLALTRNGSIVSSGPHVRPSRNRTLHYMRMPSRNISMSSTDTRRGQLTEDIRVGQRFRSTAYDTSYVTMLLYISRDKAAEFEQLREWAHTGVTSVHLSVSQLFDPNDT